jgi:hypothetical protein
MVVVMLASMALIVSSDNVLAKENIHSSLEPTILDKTTKVSQLVKGRILGIMLKGVTLKQMKERLGSTPFVNHYLSGSSLIMFCTYENLGLSITLEYKKNEDVFRVIGVQFKPLLNELNLK